MKIIPNPAEDVTHIPAAKQLNVTASATNGPDGNISDGGGDEKKKPHGFSKTLARIKNTHGEELGWHAAIILRYLSFMVRRHSKDINGKRWARINLDHITKQYPYIGRSTVDENVLRLKEFGCCVIENLNAEFKRRKNDRTRCYHVPRKWMDAAEEEPRYFNPEIAALVGVPAASIYYNFCHWIDDLEAQEAVKQWELRPAVLMELQPFSKSTIKRAIKLLANGGFIEPVPGSQCLYAPGTSKMRGSNPDEGGSKVDEGGSKADESGSNPDNYICYSHCSLLEECSKGEPAAPSSQHSSCPEKDNQPVVSGHDENLPSGDEQQREEYGHDTSSVVQHDAPSPPSGPLFSSLAELHARNEELSSLVPQIDPTTDTIREKMWAVACRFLELFDEDKIDDWNLITDAEELFDALVPAYTAFIFDDLKDLDPKGKVFSIVSGGTLECIIGAFMWTKCHTGYTHGITALQGMSYNLWLPISEVLENLRMRLVKEEFDLRKIDYASRDADKEHDTTLTPAEKARVFRNGVNSINQVGAIFYDQQLRTDFITTGPKVLILIQRIFEHNPDASPADLLTIMHQCVEAYVNQPPARCKFKHGIRWNARTGATSLLLFAKNLKAIVKELGIHDCPIKTFLGDITKEQPQEEPMALAA